MKPANPQKFFLSNLPQFFSYVNSNQILPMILLLAAGHVFTLLPSILGLIALFVLYALVYKLAVDVLLETAHGNMLPGDFQSSFEAKSILIQFIVVGLCQKGILIWLLYFVKDPLILVSYIFASTFLTPAIFMVLSVTNSITSALNPMTIIRLIKPLFFSYLCFVGFWLLLEYLQLYAIEPLFYRILPELFANIVILFFKFFIMVLNFHIMGFLIFQNRESYGFEAMFNSENDDESLTLQQAESNPIHQRIRSLILAGNFSQAALIIAELKKNGDNSNELLVLEKQIEESAKDDKTKSLSDAESIHELINENKIGAAFKLYSDLILENKKFIEKDPTDINVLAKYAFSAEKFQMVVDIVKFFHNKYPGHEDIVANYFLLAQVLYRNQNTKAKAQTILNGLIKKYPNHKLNSQLSSWLKGMELMNQK